jgi:hypothetical protein
VVVTSIARDRGRAIGVALALAILAALLLAPLASGAADPIQSGKLTLKLSSSFKKQLKKNHVSMKPTNFTINGGTLDPATGAGTVNLKGKLTFKKGGKKVVYSKLKATLGKNGNIKGKAGKVFSLKGGKVTRNGFGANITNVKLKFLKSAAKKINKSLGLHSLKQGNAGKATANNVQPSEVTLVSGTSTLSPDFGTFAKFANHCVDPTGTGSTGTPGIAPVAPATAIAGPAFQFPVTGGTVGLTGQSGAIQGAGGIQITQNINVNVSGSNCNLVVGATPNVLTQDQLVVDLNSKQVQAHIVIANTGQAALDGDKGTAFIGTIDLSGAQVTTDAATRHITIKNAVAAFNATSALVLNGVFPCDFTHGINMTTGCDDPSVNPASAAFVTGDKIGTISVDGTAG